MSSRLMLGKSGIPWLLVTVLDETLSDFDEFGAYSGTGFKFYVVNGSWEGWYHPHGNITVWSPEPSTLLDTIDVLTTNQDRLRGYYNDVFDNFHNVWYVGPHPDLTYFEELFSDDIPF